MWDFQQGVQKMLTLVKTGNVLPKQTPRVTSSPTVQMHLMRLAVVSSFRVQVFATLDVNIKQAQFAENPARITNTDLLCIYVDPEQTAAYARQWGVG